MVVSELWTWLQGFEWFIRGMNVGLEQLNVFAFVKRRGTKIFPRGASQESCFRQSTQINHIGPQFPQART